MVLNSLVITLEVLSNMHFYRFSLTMGFLLLFLVPLDAVSHGLVSNCLPQAGTDTGGLFNFSMFSFTIFHNLNSKISSLALFGI